MGSVSSTPEQCAKQADPVEVSCSKLPAFGEFASNADIAGPGVITSFGATAGLTIFLSICLLTLQGWKYRWWGESTIQERLKEKINREHRDRWRRLFDGILISFSDQQIITSFSLMVATRMLACTISAYHYDLICDLVFISIAIHLCTINVVDRYFNNIILGSIRAVLITITFVLAGLLFTRRSTPTFPINQPLNPTEHTTGLVAPAVCFQSANTSLFDDIGPISDPDRDRAAESKGNVLVVVVMTLYPISLILAGLHSFLTSPRRSEIRVVGRRALWVLRVCASGVAFYIGLTALKHFLDLQNWMKNSGWFGDEGESEWRTFGQYVPCFMLFLAVLAFVEAWVDKHEAKGRRIVGSTQSGKRNLWNGELGRYAPVGHR